MNHTKGPWKRMGDRQVAKSDDGIICTCWYFGNKGSVAIDEAEANARLVAAAPDMLNALIYLCSEEVDLELAVDKGILAIEKATCKTLDEIEEEQ